MTGPRGSALLDLWLALAAGRLLLRRPDDPGLSRLALPHLATDTPLHLAETIARGADTLFSTLEARPDADPLARIASGCRLSGFDLDLLALAVLPCFDEDAAGTIATLTGGPRRVPVGLALKLLFGDLADPLAVRSALRASPLWHAGLIRPDEARRPLLERRLDPTEALLAGLDGMAPAEVGAGWRVRRLTPPAHPAASIRRAAGQISPMAGVCLHLSGQAERAEEVLAVAAAPAPALVLDAPDDSTPPPCPPKPACPRSSTNCRA